MDLSITTAAIDALFGSTMANTQANMDNLAGTILGQGIDLFQNGKYEQAIGRFRQAAALSPVSDRSFSAYNFMARAYVKLDKQDQAIKTYEEAIRTFPTTSDDTFYVALADLYMQEERPGDALEMYEKAVSINSSNAESRYSLGQSYISSGELDKARRQFKAVVDLTPTSAAGYYGLGQVAHLEGDQQEAVSKLTKAISVNKQFELAYLELGYVYADMGEYLKAEEQSSILSAKGSDKSATLDAYITLARQPRMVGALSPNGFAARLGPGTAVSSLSSTLASANKSKLFAMNFSFSKDMDELSVIKASNWTISRATLQNNGGIYNYGLKPSATEASIASVPAYVIFDKDTNTATVYFRLAQNATADATIDPRHIVFKFNGLDAYGKAMDASADEYAGFSGIA